MMLNDMDKADCQDCKAVMTAVTGMEILSFWIHMMSVD